MKTVRVRIAVAVDVHAKAVAAGTHAGSEERGTPEKLLEDWAMLEGWSPEEKLAFYWIEADVPIPNPAQYPTCEGTVTQ